MLSSSGPGPGDTVSGGRDTQHNHVRASPSIANSLSGALRKLPFWIFGGSPAASTSSFSAGSARR